MPVERIPWADFLRRWYLSWEQGDHCTVIGPTKSGKTLLITELVERRTYVAAMATKNRDRSLDRLKARGYRVIRKWEPPQRKDTRLVLWPKIRPGTDLELMPVEQEREIRKALNWLYWKGHYCVWLDELRYLSDELRMKRFIATYYTQARSSDISLVGATQRPAFVPLEAYSNAGHLLIFRTGDERDLERIGSLNGMSGRVAARIVDQLPQHEFLWVDMSHREMAVSKLELSQAGERPKLRVVEKGA